MNTQPRIGVDIGRVIISPGKPLGTASGQLPRLAPLGSPIGDGPDTSFFNDAYLEVPPVEGAFDGVARLVRAFAGRVWLVSKCGQKIQRRTLEWLEARDFYAQTGVAPENVRFCKERPQKADHARQLGLTHFIDDRADVLQVLEGLVANRFLFGPQKHPAPRGLVPVEGWRDLLAIL